MLLLSINQLVIGVLLFTIGFFDFFSKDSVDLIAGYNTKSAEEKSRKNETAIREFIGIMHSHSLSIVYKVNHKYQ
jgi:hypothetical protein